MTLLATEAVAPDALDADERSAEHDEVLEALQHPASDEEYADLLARRRWIETRQALVKK